MSIYCLNGSVVRDGGVVWLDTDNSSVFLMSCMNSSVSASPTALIQKPKVGELCWERSGNVEISYFREIRRKIVEENKGNCRVWCEKNPEW